MGGRGAGGGRCLGAGGRRRREPALQTQSPGGAGGARGGRRRRRRRRSSAARPPRPPACPSAGRQLQLSRRVRPPPAGARGRQSPGGWAERGGWRPGGGPGTLRALAGCSWSRRSASLRCVSGRADGSLLVVSGDGLGGDCPAVKGLHLGGWRPGVLGRREPGRGVLLADAPALPSPVEAEPPPLVLKVIDRLKGYFRLGDTLTNEDLLRAPGDSSVTNLREKIKGCPARCTGALGEVPAELAAGDSRGDGARSARRARSPFVGPRAAGDPLTRRDLPSESDAFSPPRGPSLLRPPLGSRSRPHVIKASLTVSLEYPHEHLR